MVRATVPVFKIVIRNSYDATQEVKLTAVA